MHSYHCGDTKSPPERTTIGCRFTFGLNFIVPLRGFGGKAVRVSANGASRTPSPDAGIVKGVAQHP